MPFRDTKTGRFVSKATWTRSKARGGKRYRREPIKRRRAIKPPRPPSLGVEINVGYQGRGNSYTLVVHLNTYRRIERYTDEQLADFVEKLAQAGHFDHQETNPHPDLRWIAVNDWNVSRRDVVLARGRAILVEFLRGVGPSDLENLLP